MHDSLTSFDTKPLSALGSRLSLSAISGFLLTAES